MLWLVWAWDDTAAVACADLVGIGLLFSDYATEEIPSLCAGCARRRDACIRSMVPTEFFNVECIFHVHLRLIGKKVNPTNTLTKRFLQRFTVADLKLWADRKMRVGRS
jgi:hypothetical protein